MQALADGRSRERELVQQKQVAEQLLRQTDKHYRRLLETIPDLVLIILRDGLLLGSCGGRHGFHSFHPETLTGATLSDFVAPETDATLRKVIDDVLAGGKPETMEFDFQVKGNSYHVEAHLTPFDTQSVTVILRDLTERTNAAALLNGLTIRERQILEAVVAGKPNKAIAQELGVVVKTVEAHRGQLMKKLRTRSVAELVRLTVAAAH